jgi:hypothetical protein
MTAPSPPLPPRRDPEADLAAELAAAAHHPIARLVRPTHAAEAQMLGIWRGLLEPVPGCLALLRLRPARTPAAPRPTAPWPR